MINIGIFGDQGAGKSTLISRWIDENFDNKIQPSISLSFRNTQLEIAENTYNASILDFPGILPNMDMSIINTIVGVIIVIDLSNMNAFYTLQNWINFIRTKRAEIPIAIFGNKSDIRTIALEFCKVEAQKYGVQYYDMSAFTGFGVDDGFNDFIFNAVNGRNVKMQQTQYATDPQSAIEYNNGYQYDDTPYNDYEDGGCCRI